jgi:hypothetical protein
MVGQGNRLQSALIDKTVGKMEARGAQARAADGVRQDWLETKEFLCLPM